MNQDKTQVNVGCGCFPLLFFIFVILTIIYGLKTPWFDLDVDFFPPAIHYTDY